MQGQSFFHSEAKLEGRKHPDEVIVVGAHYDAHGPSPGANDNASGVAALLELAEVLRPRSFSRTLRFVAFTNEEAPFTRSVEMGSRQYARRCRERRDTIVAMICLETIGCAWYEKGTQRLSFNGLLLPRREGNGTAQFLYVVSAAWHRHAINGLPSQWIGAFRAETAPLLTSE